MVFPPPHSLVLLFILSYPLSYATLWSSETLSPENLAQGKDLAIQLMLLTSNNLRILVTRTWSQSWDLVKIAKSFQVLNLHDYVQMITCGIPSSLRVLSSRSLGCSTLILDICNVGPSFSISANVPLGNEASLTSYVVTP